MNTKQSGGLNITLIFFAFAFFVVLLGLFSKYSFQPVGIKKTSQGNESAPTKSPQKLKIAVDFSRTVGCNYQDATASTSAIIQNAKIFVKSEKTTFLLTNDCLYRWQLAQRTGNRVCGVGQYVSIGETLLTSGLLTNDSVGDMIKKMGGSTILSSIDVQKILNTCKNIKEVKEDIFTIPQGVAFN